MGAKLTQQQFLNKLKGVHGDEVTTDDTYRGSKIKMWFHCNKGLGHKDWRTLPTNIMRYGCPKCGAEKLAKDRKLTQQEFLDRLHKKHSNNIVCTDTYINSKTPIWFHCNICDNNWKDKPNIILSKSGCPKCNSSNYGFSIDDVKDRVYSIHGNKYTVLSTTYVSAHTPLKVKCNICGNIWYPTYANLSQGRGCNNCKSSFGEQNVASILEFNNIRYKPQQYIYFRKHNHRLDFVLRDRDNNVCVIQPDGEQHFRVSENWGGIQEFEDRKQRDKDENNYLPMIGIRVLRIPYFWFDIGNVKILLEQFLYYNLKTPNKEYLPAYKKIAPMCKEYLDTGNLDYVSNKYGVCRKTVMEKFKQYYGMCRSKYIRL